MEAIVARFYEYLQQGKIMGMKCKRCGSYNFPPRGTCLICGSPEQEWVEINGKGKLLYASATNRGRGAWPVNYVLGTVKLVEGPIVIGRILIENFDFTKLENIWKYNGANIDVVAQIVKNPKGIESVAFRPTQRYKKVIQ
ncbi:MAG: zinc ribbon domain-containing protein [Candidatus Jordarchaeaceae archaeon]